MNILSYLFNLIVKAFVPDRCRICAEVIELDSELCDDCKKLPVIAPPLCKSCGANVHDCKCKKNKNQYKQVIAPYYYKDSIVKGVHNFKDNNMPFLAEGYACDMASCFNENYSDIDFDFITFVACREFKRRLRGFNQAQLLAEKLSDIINIPVKNVLDKVKYSGVQHHKSAHQRRIDIYGAFDVKEEFRDKLDGKTILLVDDVKTTGSTLNECASMLKIFGAKEVYAITFAITNNIKKVKKK